MYTTVLWYHLNHWWNETFFGHYNKISQAYNPSPYLVPRRLLLRSDYCRVLVVREDLLILMSDIYHSSYYLSNKVPHLTTRTCVEWYINYEWYWDHCSCVGDFVAIILNAYETQSSHCDNEHRKQKKATALGKLVVDGSDLLIFYWLVLLFFTIFQNDPHSQPLGNTVIHFQLMDLLSNAK